MDDREGMSVIVRTVARWLLGMIFVFGLAIALTGHLSPGGGFAGGVVLAGGYILATLAFGGRAGPAAPVGRAVPLLEALGASGFLAIAALGWLSGEFFTRWLPLGPPFRIGSTPFVVLMNVAILLKVGAGLAAGFLAVALFRLPVPGDRGREP